MRIAIIGCGTIGSGIARRLSSEHSLVLYNRHPERAAQLAQELNEEHVADIGKAVAGADVVILAFKPNNLSEAAPSINAALTEKQLLISVLAATDLQKLKSYFPKTPLLRMMPNIALVYGQGVIGLVESDQIQSRVKVEAEAICQLLGKCYWVTEEKLEALSALTGSGPAFVFVMVEAMVEAAIALGFNAQQGQELVMQMMLGSLTMLSETGKHPAELKWTVASPGGTTIAGLNKMEEERVRYGIMQAFIATRAKALEMKRML
jgi:pyrroline-5-carboxylate reductase